MKFKCTEVPKGQSVTLQIEGHFDEHAVLPNIDPKVYPTITFDFEKVVSINSVGVRTWIKWVGERTGKSQIVYIKCPKIIVDQMNMVASLAKSGRVDSFFTPYFCETSSTSLQILFQRGKEYTEQSLTPPKAVPCPEGGSDAEMDVIEKTYFKFLNVPPTPKG